MHVCFKTPMGRRWQEALSPLKNAFPEVRFSECLPGDARGIENADALVAGELSREEIQAASRLKMVFVPYAGVDALPHSEIQRRGIRVCNVHVNAPFVAERAIALALAFYGKIISYHQDLKRCQWHGYWAGLGIKDTWSSIRDRSCAVIGAGKIGKCIARHLKVFECPVIGFKKHPVKDPLKNFDAVTSDLWEAVKESELIFVSLPLTPETRGIFNESILKQMAGKFIVNVGRGELLEEKAFFESLKDGILKGAAIDAWYAYPGPENRSVPPSRYPFHELENVLLSPHVAGFTPEAAARNIEATVENIRAFLETGRPKWEVDPRAMY